MRMTDRFADWAERNGIPYRPLLQYEEIYRDVLDRIEREVVEEIKAEHECSPKYQYEEKTSDKVLQDSAVEVVSLNATYVKGASKGKTIFVDGEILSAEAYAARHFRSQGYEVIEAESVPFHVLFGCLLYRVVCDPTDPLLKTVMFGDRNAFERGKKGINVVTVLPVDFGSLGYGRRRAEAVTAHLSAIGRGSKHLLAEFDNMFDESGSLRQYLWAHRKEDAEAARALIEIIPCDRVVKILQYLIGDYWRNYIGWPDLLVHHPKSAEDYFFAEVKGAGDRLSGQQKHWIEANRKELLLPFKVVKIRRRRAPFCRAGSNSR